MDLFKSTIEYRSWGANVATYSFLGTMLFSLLQGWALFAQNGTIRRKRSGESIAVIYFVYGFCYFAAFFVYGVAKMSIAMAVNGLLFVPYLPILTALERWKGFSRADWLSLLAFSLMIPAIELLKGDMRDVFVLLGLFGCLVPGIFQFMELLRTKSPGAIDPRFIVAFMFSCIFWFIFGLMTGNWIFVAFNPVSFFLLGSTLVVYLKYKRFSPAV